MRRKVSLCQKYYRISKKNTVSKDGTRKWLRYCILEGVSSRSQEFNQITAKKK